MLDRTKKDQNTRNPQPVRTPLKSRTEHSSPETTENGIQQIATNSAQSKNQQALQDMADHHGQSLAIQPKLRIGDPNDRFERELIQSHRKSPRDWNNQKTPGKPVFNLKFRQVNLFSRKRLVAPQRVLLPPIWKTPFFRPGRVVRS